MYTLPDWPVAAVLQILYHRRRCYLSAEVVMGIYSQSEISVHQSSKSQRLFTIAQLQLLYNINRVFIKITHKQTITTFLLGLYNSVIRTNPLEIHTFLFFYCL